MDLRGVWSPHREPFCGQYCSSTTKCVRGGTVMDARAEAITEACPHARALPNPSGHVSRINIAMHPRGYWTYRHPFNRVVSIGILKV